MPRTKADHTNTSGVARQTADGVFYQNGRYLCQRVENGTPCNKEMAGNTHSISSHNSRFHRAGPYRELQAAGDFKCFHENCEHRSPTFHAILGHIRYAHGFRGSSDAIKLHYGIPVNTKRKREGNAEESGSKKPRQEAEETAPEDNPQTTLGTIAEETPQQQQINEGGSEGNGQEPKENEDGAEAEAEAEASVEEFMNEFIDFDAEHNPADDDELLGLIDPALRQWDKDHDRSGGGGAAGSGSGLGGQILSDAVVPAEPTR
ncbi:hypothetical protein GGR51DRAFT_574063 [Nemania sp. FL0031]|nr:hypothetical protein GGR51DRAFT_574063 [Nemania sp. FL0031]